MPKSVSVDEDTFKAAMLKIINSKPTTKAELIESKNKSAKTTKVKH